MKVVINTCFGGFSISKECAERMKELGCLQAKAELEASSKYWYGSGHVGNFEGGYKRTSPYLIQAVEELGVKANGKYSRIVVVKIPEDIKWYIDEYDGRETIREEHRSWS